jgi:TonB family protein
MLSLFTAIRRWKQCAFLPIGMMALGITACEQKAARVKPVAKDAAESRAVPPSSAIDPQVAPPPPTPGVRNLLDTKVYQYVDQMPRYQGGPEHLLADVTKQIRYPAAAKAAKLQGKVFVAFVVSEEGRVQDVQLQKGITASPHLEAAAQQINEAAVAAVQALPGKWTPGQQNGNAVPVAFTIPVNFVLN